MNEHSRLPRYVTIMEEVQNFIRDRHLRPGDQIPTEANLMEQFGVSRATVRQAIQELVNEGVVEKKHGSGTFVAEPKLSIEMNGFFSFYEEAAQQVGDLSMSIRHFSCDEEPSGKIRHRLRLGIGERVVSVQRIRSIDGDPILFEQTYLPGSVFGGLSERDFEDRSMYEVFRDRGIARVAGSERFRPFIPDEMVRDTLDIGPDIPVFRFSRFLEDESARAVEYTVAYLKTGKVELSTTIDRAL